MRSRQGAVTERSQETSFDPPEGQQGAIASLAQSVYNGIADHYNDRWSRHVVVPQERLTRALELRQRERVLDLACGTGVDTVEMLKQVTPGEVIGVDCSDAMLAAAVERAAAQGLQLQTICGDAESVLARAAPESFDVISIRFALAYLDWGTLLPRIPSILRPSGRLGILTSLAVSAPQAYSIYGSMCDDFGIPEVEPNTPRALDDVERALPSGHLKIKDRWEFAFRLWFESGTAAAEWLLETGYLTHPLMERLTPDMMPAIISEFDRRIERFREPSGIPLDFLVAGIVAQRRQS